MKLKRESEVVAKRASFRKRGKIPAVFASPGIAYDEDVVMIVWDNPWYGCVLFNDKLIRLN